MCVKTPLTTVYHNTLGIAIVVNYDSLFPVYLQTGDYPLIWK